MIKLTYALAFLYSFNVEAAFSCGPSMKNLKVVKDVFPAPMRSVCYAEDKIGRVDHSGVNLHLPPRVYWKSLSGVDNFAIVQNSGASNCDQGCGRFFMRSDCALLDAKEVPLNVNRRKVRKVVYRPDSRNGKQVVRPVKVATWLQGKAKPRPLFLAHDFVSFKGSSSSFDSSLIGAPGQVQGSPKHPNGSDGQYGHNPLSERVFEIDGGRDYPAAVLWLYALALIGIGVLGGEIAARSILRNQQGENKDDSTANH
ncbi:MULTISPECIES: hypothetical protein [Roseovarius]|uniref:hypothetical protein n=1 Tax=Roseovarius TaxID=74030 RepID=UPI00273F6D08|nr:MULTISPECIES: hypothetical protein [unclassified Roseovarius]